MKPPFLAGNALVISVVLASAVAASALPDGPAAAPAASQRGFGVDSEDFIRLQCTDEPGRENLDLRIGLPQDLPVDDAVQRAFAAEYGSRAGFLHYRRRDGRQDDEQHYVVPLGAVEISRRRVTLLFDCGRERDCILASGAPGGRTRQLGFACHLPHLVLELMEDWIDRNVHRPLRMNPSVPMEMSR